MSRIVASPFDEAHAAPDVPRAHYAPLMAALAAADLTAVREGAARRAEELGASFGAGHDADTFPIDPVPRVIAAGEWAALEAGIDQRVRALNAFVADAYGPRAIVDAGIVAAGVIDGAEGYEPELRGRLPADVMPIAIAGLDVVRDPAGTFRVLEDNCRSPSGLAYAIAVREATDAVVDVPGLRRRDIVGPIRELLTAVLRDAAPAGAADPFTVVLTDGPENLAFWEHARLAEMTGATLVTVDELERRGERLHARPGGGTSRPVDVLYRRCDEDRMRDADGRPTRLAELVTEPWVAGALGLVNGLGTGVADDKLVHAHVEEMIGFYLGEPVLLASVPTLDLNRPAELEEVLGDLEDFVVKPRGGSGGRGVVVCAHAEQGDLDALRQELRRTPEDYIAQRTVSLSCMPVVVDGGRLEPRHVDLRPFTFSGRGRTRTLAGGLTRVAMEAGALVVNSSQSGGAKDTWILE